LAWKRRRGAASWLHGFIDWAKPFRMPDFFLISGLFLTSRINRPWREYADSKILHFAYFYILWMSIQFATNGYSHLPGFSLILGFIGAAAVVSTGVLLSKTRIAAPLRYAGENSIVFYLAFFLFMAATRSLLLKYNVISDLGSIVLLTTAAGVLGPILLFRATHHTKLSLLFRRPSWVRLASRPAQWHSDGHVTFKQPEARGPSLSR
jgi:uncharacterized membrane protein YcfT